jgi:uncharacterized protein
LKDIIAGIELFNKADFFAAHDFFEDCWFDCKRNEKFFFQGLVQVSVGCYHLISGNFKGASSQFQKGIKKLKEYDSPYMNVNLQLLIKKLEPIIIELGDCSSKVEPNKFWDKIPRIEFIK